MKPRQGDEARPRPAGAWWRTILVHAALAGAVVLAGVVAPVRELLIDHEPRLAPLLVAAALAAKLATSLAPRRRGSARSLRLGERRLGRALARWGWAPAVLLWLLPLWSHWSGRPPDYLAAWQLPLGQIPWSDGSFYFEGAHQLLAHGRFGRFAEQKPLFPALLAVGLALAQGSLGAVLLWRNALVGLCTFLAAREVGLRYGLWCALGTFGATLGLGRGVSAAVVTEPLGIAFGALAMAVLVSAAARRSPRRLAAGLFLLAVALQVRPGMQFVLIALGLWMAWHFRPRRARAVAWAAAAMVAGTLLTSALGRLYGAGESSFYARPAFFVYGLVRGTNEMQASKDFAARLDEFPNEGAFARFVYAQAWSEFRREPATALRSLALGTSRTVEKNLKALAAAVNVTRLSATDHHRGDGTEVAWPGLALLGILCALSVVKAWKSRERAFWLAVLAGSLASGAFVGNDNPVHGAAAVHPLFALGACLGLATGPIPKRVRPGSAAAAQESRTVRACLWASAAVILVALAGPAWAWRAWPRPTSAMLMGMQLGRDVVIAREASPAVAVGPGGLTFRRYVGLLELGATDMEGLQPPAPFAVLSAWDFVGRRQRVVYAPIEVARAEGFLHMVIEEEQAAPNQQDVVRTGAWRSLGPWKNQPPP